MILPIHIYGSPKLREVSTRIEADSQDLQQLIDDMVETMHGASGIGLAAPQVGRSERLFVVDLTPLSEDEPDLPQGPMVFINPDILEESAVEEEFEEGCLSLPDIREYVSRPHSIKLRYLNRDFQEVTLEATGMLARVIQHEYDHLDGILFIDHISPFRRRLLRRRLKEMALGKTKAEYPLYSLHAD